VYYGVRLGRKIEWYTGFPYSHVPHPQYVGCILSLWAVVLMLFNQALIEKVRPPHHALGPDG
jgi:protein-S-isoprenylcysteine O-methyltransferase Ste14